MRTKPYYLCIFGRNDNDDISYVVYTTSFQSKLDKLNSSIESAVYYCVCGYEVNANLNKPKSTFIRYLYKKIPNLKRVENESYAFYIHHDKISQVLVDFIRYIDACYAVLKNKIESDDDTLYTILSSDLTPTSAQLSFFIDGKFNEAMGESIIKDISRYFSIKDDGMHELFFLKSLDEKHRFFKIKIDIKKFESNVFILIRDSFYKRFIVYFVQKGHVIEDNFFTDNKYVNFEGYTYIRAVDHNEDLLLELIIGDDVINLDDYFFGNFNYYFLDEIPEQNKSKFIFDRRTTDLSKYLDVDMFEPEWIEFNGEHYQVYNYIDFLDVSLNMFYDLYPDKLEELAAGNKKYGTLDVLSRNLDNLYEGMKLKNSDIYFETRLSDKTAFAFVISLAKELNINKSSFKFQVVRKVTPTIM